MPAADSISSISSNLCSEEAWDQAASLLDQCAGQPAPDEADRAALVNAVQLFNALGYAEQARGILRGWRETGFDTPALRRAELFLHVSGAPDAAAAHTTGGVCAELLSKGECAALETIRRLFRGEAQAAIACAESAGWFLDEPSLAHGLFHGLWALFLTDNHDRAQALIAEWQLRHGSAAPWSRALVRRLQAALCGARHQYVDEAEHLAAVLEIERDGGLPVQAAYTEAAFVGARARAGDLEVARSIVARWPTPCPTRVASRGPIEAYRDRARAELSMIGGDDRDAFAAASRAANAFYGAGHLVMASHMRFLRVMTAVPAEFATALSDLRAIVRRTNLARCTQRLALIDDLAASGATSLAEHPLDEITPWSRNHTPLHRAFSPSVTMTGADLFWNRVCGAIFLRGKGPFYLERQPILTRALEILTRAPGERLAIADFFAAVWDSPYDPLLHEGKVHVTVHRLRKWFGERDADARRLLEVTDGTIGFRRHADVRVLMPSNPPPPALATLDDRVLAAVARAPGPVAPRTLEHALGASRTAIQRSVRILIANGSLVRHGKSRSTTYTVK